MSYPQKVSAEQVVEAYMRTGSVWKAARDLGVVGQSVWERLRALGHPMKATRWTLEEITEAQSLVGVVSIGEIAKRLGRPYAGVACKLSDLGVLTMSPRARKIPRGKGYTKLSMRKLMAAAEADPRTITRFCRSRKLSIDVFIAAAQKYMPERWTAYAAARSPIPQRACDYCSGPYVPMSGKQRACSRKCQTDMRVDRDYFGGKRRTTIGLAERVCQLCERKDVKGLSSHHLIGKENDPDNENLIALCPGCHQVVTLLGRKNFILKAEGWENLISIAVMRRVAEVNDGRVGAHVAVDIDWLTSSDLEDMIATDGPP